LLAIGACYGWLHQAWRYQGGAIQDNGVISYPRFSATFAPIPFDRAGSRTYEFSRYPADQAVVFLKMGSPQRADALEPLTTRMTVSVRDRRGFRCQATGYPAGRSDEQAFVTASPVYATGIWLLGCNPVSVAGCNPCTLSVEISDVDPRTPRLDLIPSLEGGGIELP